MLDLNFKNSSVASLNLRSVVFTLLKAWQAADTCTVKTTV